MGTKSYPSTKMKYFVVFLAVFFVVVQGKPADDEHGQLANGKDKEDDCTEEDGCERRRDSDDHDQLANGKDKEEDCTEEMAASAVEIQVIAAVKISWSHFMDLE